MRVPQQAVKVRAVRAFRIGEKTYFPAAEAVKDDDGKVITGARKADEVDLEIGVARDVVATGRAEFVSA